MSACKDCQYFVKAAGDITNTQGNCRRYPPYPQIVALPIPPKQLVGGLNEIKMQQLNALPIVGVDNWCGEFKAVVEAN
jgi:hypothetical protein